MLRMGKHAALRLWGLCGWAALAADTPGEDEVDCVVERSRWRGFEVSALENAFQPPKCVRAQLIR